MITKKFEMRTRQVAETQNLGKTIGTLLENPCIIALNGNLGSGKTVFVQGLAKGLEVPADYYITSPTFTLVNEYPGRFRLFHVDLYRLNSTSDLEDLGWDDLLSEPAVIAVEWADKLAADSFDEYLAVNLQISANRERRISLIAYGQTGVNLIKRLEKLTMSDIVS
jgi:tRNA threonylcarbamoyladenosine biosynthesis protein TsaE